MTLTYYRTKMMTAFYIDYSPISTLTNRSTHLQICIMPNGQQTPGLLLLHLLTSQRCENIHRWRPRGSEHETWLQSVDRHHIYNHIPESNSSAPRKFRNLTTSVHFGRPPSLFAVSQYVGYCISAVIQRIIPERSPQNSLHGFMHIQCGNKWVGRWLNLNISGSGIMWNSTPSHFPFSRSHLPPLLSFLLPFLPSPFPSLLPLSPSLSFPHCS